MAPLFRLAPIFVLKSLDTAICSPVILSGPLYISKNPKLLLYAATLSSASLYV